MKRNQLKRLKVVALVPMTLIGALGGNVKVYAKEGDGVQQKIAVVQLKKVPDGMELEDVTEEEQKEIFNNLHKEPEKITDIKIIEVEEIPDDVKVVEVEEQKANEFVEKVEELKESNEIEEDKIIIEKITQKEYINIRAKQLGITEDEVLKIEQFDKKNKNRKGLDEVKSYALYKREKNIRGTKQKALMATTITYIESRRTGKALEIMTIGEMDIKVSQGKYQGFDGTGSTVTKYRTFGSVYRTGSLVYSISKWQASGISAGLGDILSISSESGFSRNYIVTTQQMSMILEFTLKDLDNL